MFKFYEVWFGWTQESHVCFSLQKWRFCRQTEVTIVYHLRPVYLAHHNKCYARNLYNIQYFEIAILTYLFEVLGSLLLLRLGLLVDRKIKVSLCGIRQALTCTRKA